MTWAKLSDDFSDDCWTLSDAAFRLHVEGLVWSNRKLLDLHLPAEDVRRFAKCPEAVAELLAVGWWSEDGDGYVIRHHGTYQRPKEMVVRLQEVATKNGKKGGRPPREQAPRNPAANPAANPRVNPQGQARTGQGSKTEPPTEVEPESTTSWPPVTTPGRPPVVDPEPEPTSCRSCHEPMVVIEPGQQTHPACEVAA